MTAAGPMTREAKEAKEASAHTDLNMLDWLARAGGDVALSELRALRSQAPECFDEALALAEPGALDDLIGALCRLSGREIEAPIPLVEQERVVDARWTFAGSGSEGVVAGGMLLPPGDERAASFVRELSLINPAWTQWQRHGRGPMPERTLSPCVVMDGGPWRGGLVVPRFARGVSGADRMSFPEAQPLFFRGELRPYQRAAINAVLDHFSAEEAEGTCSGLGAVVEAPCGAGKTTIACGLMAEIATPALVLVHTRDLALQWLERIKEFLGIDAALVGYGKASDASGARIAVASMQTLSRWGWWRVHQWGLQWGMVVQDEAHHVPARTFTEVMSALSARVRLGLTATPKRADGLTPWLHYSLGPTVARIDPSIIERAGSVLAPTVALLRMECPDMGSMESHERDRALAANPARNAAICDAARDAVREGRRVLVLVKLVEHAFSLADMIRDSGLCAYALVGSLAKTIRADIIDRMRAGTVEVVVATSLADEGLDAPRLDTAILAHPSGDVAKVEQRIGRVCRPHPEARPPMVLDIVDLWGPYQGYAKRRQRLYRERKWQVLG